MPKPNEGEATDAVKDAAPSPEKKPVEKKPEPPSLEGLIKMKRDGKIIHAHPSTLHDHKKNGWKEV